jgi:hypothetical protein
MKTMEIASNAEALNKEDTRNGSEVKMTSVDRNTFDGAKAMENVNVDESS